MKENCSPAAVNCRISERDRTVCGPGVLPCDVRWASPSRQGRALPQGTCHNTPKEWGCRQESAQPPVLPPAHSRSKDIRYSQLLSLLTPASPHNPSMPTLTLTCLQSEFLLILKTQPPQS